MTVLCLVSDLHLSDRPPSSCTDSYQDDLFGLLEQAGALARQRRAAAMVWAGDIFHQKAPSRVSHRLVHRVCGFIGDCGFPVYVVPGNHDIANDRIESVWESQPLGMLFRAGAVELRGWDSRLPLYGVPWLQGYGSYRGHEYTGERPEPEIDARVGGALQGYRERVSGSGTGTELPLVVTHAPLYPEGKELPYEHFPARRWAEAMGAHRGGRHSVFYGHVHEPHGTYGLPPEPGHEHEQGWDVTFCNNGALSRGSLHEYNLTRQVGATFYDTATGEFEFVPLDARPASEVFRLQEKQQATDMQGRLDGFLASVGSTSLEVLDIESVVAHVKSLGLGKDMEDLVEELLQEARHG